MTHKASCRSTANASFSSAFRERRAFEFPEFPAEGPKLESILETDVPDKYTLTDHLWKYLQDYAAKHKAAGNGFGFGLVTGKDIDADIERALLQRRL